MRKPEMQSNGQNFGMKDSFNLTYALAHAHAMCITPFIRSGFGYEAFGFTSLAAMIGMLLLGGLAPAPSMFTYLVLWLYAVVIQRGWSWQAERSGEHTHSKYQGRPTLAMGIPFVKRESTAKAWVEPLICLIAGRLLYFLSPFVGDFVMWGSFSLAFTAQVQHRFWQARVRRLRDAQLEQEHLMQMFNNPDEF
jgi:hypothetical protein